MPSLAEEVSRETERILLKLIDNAAKKAEMEIEKTGTLSMEHAIPLLLKSQYNHILHLDEELANIRKIMDDRFSRMDDRFSRMEGQFSKMDERISDIYKWMFGCFVGTVTILGGLMSFLKFFVR